MGHRRHRPALGNGDNTDAFAFLRGVRSEENAHIGFAIQKMVEYGSRVACLIEPSLDGVPYPHLGQQLLRSLSERRQLGIADRNAQSLVLGQGLK